jgi:hypothetical protein
MREGQLVNIEVKRGQGPDGLFSSFLPEVSKFTFLAYIRRITEKHPHIIEMRRLRSLKDPTSEDRLKLMVLEELINLNKRIQNEDSNLCYMTACDLIEEMLKV